MSIQVTTLSNGLRVATDTMPHVETVSLGAWVAAGTRNERPEVNGVAHLLEHMVFKGTARRSAQAIAEEVEAVGGQINAYTARENTAYYCKVLKDDAPLAVDIVADILQHSKFDPDELARERTVVLQEIGQANDTPDDIVFDHFQATAFADQGVGRPVLGTAEIVGRMPREALTGYLADHYSGDRMVLAAAGNIAHERAVEMAEAAFSHLPAPKPHKLDPLRYTGGDFREDRDLDQLHLVFGFEALSYHDPDYYAMQVLSTALGGGMSSRLFQEVREKRGLVYSIYSYTSAYVDGGLFAVYAGTGPESAGELVPVVCDEVCRIAEDAGEAEVARARAQLRAGTLMSLESSMSRCENLAQHMLIFDRPVPVEEIVAKIDAVDAAAVRRAALRLRAKPPTVAALGPVEGLESYDRIAARLA
ncbi:MAG TPA: pitrilysin family protein [Alphaproteobacteria bacterium]|nr:pitrilysin family protein [Alphaproteobacteria bacterium]